MMRFLRKRRTGEDLASSSFFLLNKTRTDFFFVPFFPVTASTGVEVYVQRKRRRRKSPVGKKNRPQVSRELRRGKAISRRS